MNLLNELWDSTANLYTRFDVTPTVENTSLVFREEARELLLAQASEPDENVAEECADVLVTALGVLMSRGITLGELDRAIMKVVAKNDAKTHATHHLNTDGKIARRAK